MLTQSLHGCIHGGFSSRCLPKGRGHGPVQAGNSCCVTEDFLQDSPFDGIQDRSGCRSRDPRVVHIG